MRKQNPSYKYRVILLVLPGLAGISAAIQNKIDPIEAKILQVQPYGFAFETNLGAVSFRTDEKTQYWKSFGPSNKQSFAAGDLVWVTSHETKKEGTTLLELSDPATGEWLKDRRSHVQVGRLVGGNAKELALEFADGHRFVYSYNSKTRILINGKASKIGDIRLNEIYFLQPRTSSALNSSLAMISNAPLSQKSGTLITGMLEEVSGDMKVISISQEGTVPERLVLEKSSKLNLKGFNLNQFRKENRIHCRVIFTVSKSGLKIIESMDAIQ
jgi:hypothetical protein